MMRAFRALALVAALLAAWQLLYAWAGSSALTSPRDTVAYLAQLLASPTFYPHLIETATDRLGLGRGQDALSRQHPRVRLAAANVDRVEAAVEAEAGVERRGARFERAPESALSHDRAL